MSYYTKYYVYPQLGGACYPSKDVVVSNMKYIPLTDPVYDLPFTMMQKYPGTDVWKACKENEEQPASREPYLQSQENYYPYPAYQYVKTKGCCGRM